MIYPPEERTYKSSLRNLLRLAEHALPPRAPGVRLRVAEVAPDVYSIELLDPGTPPESRKLQAQVSLWGASDAEVDIMIPKACEMIANAPGGFFAKAAAAPDVSGPRPYQTAHDRDWGNLNPVAALDSNAAPAHAQSHFAGADKAERRRKLLVELMALE